MKIFSYISKTWAFTPLYHLIFFAIIFHTYIILSIGSVSKIQLLSFISIYILLRMNSYIKRFMVAIIFFFLYFFVILHFTNLTSPQTNITTPTTSSLLPQNSYASLQCRIQKISNQNIHLTRCKTNNNKIVNRIIIKNFEHLHDDSAPYFLAKITFKVKNTALQIKKNRIKLRTADIKNVIIKTNKISIIQTKLRHVVHNQIDHVINKKNELFKAMVFGIDDTLTYKDKIGFYQIGVGHILVASGANIYILTKTVTSLLFFVKNKNKVLAINILFVISYAMLLHFDGSILRATIFFLIDTVAKKKGINVTIFQKLTLTTLTIGWLMPSTILSLSYILSSFAVIGIDLSQKIYNLSNKKNWLLKYIIEALCISTSCNLITMIFFNNINYSSLISNIFLLGLAEIIVSLGFFSFLLSQLLMFLNLSYLIEIISEINVFFLNIFEIVSKILQSLLGENLSTSISINSSLTLLLFFIFCNVNVYIFYLTLKKLNSCI